jgi:hypothetical protein
VRLLAAVASPLTLSTGMSGICRIITSTTEQSSYRSGFKFDTTTLTWQTSTKSQLKILPDEKKKHGTSPFLWLTLFKKITAVYSENHKKSINALCGQNAELLKAK